MNIVLKTLLFCFVICAPQYGVSSERIGHKRKRTEETQLSINYGNSKVIYTLTNTLMCTPLSIQNGGKGAIDKRYPLVNLVLHYIINHNSSILAHKPLLCAKIQSRRGTWGVKLFEKAFIEVHNKLDEWAVFECNDDTLIINHNEGISNKDVSNVVSGSSYGCSLELVEAKSQVGKTILQFKQEI